MDTIKDIFDRTISKAIKLKLGLEIYEFTSNKLISNYVDFEEELEVNYPIKGTEVKFSINAFLKWSETTQNISIVNSKKDLSSIDITNEIVTEPIRHKEMLFVYLFSILEDYGNSLIEVVNSVYYTKEIIKHGKSWHSKVNQFAKAKGEDLVTGFAMPFNLQKEDVSEKFVNLFYGLKEKRNRIVHKLQYPEIENFYTDVQSLIVIICYLYHINDKTKSPVKFYPWYDYDENGKN